MTKSTKRTAWEDAAAYVAGFGASGCPRPERREPFPLSADDLRPYVTPYISGMLTAASNLLKRGETVVDTDFPLACELQAAGELLQHQGIKALVAGWLKDHPCPHTPVQVDDDGNPHCEICGDLIPYPPLMWEIFVDENRGERFAAGLGRSGPF